MEINKLMAATEEDGLRFKIDSIVWKLLKTISKLHLMMIALKQTQQYGNLKAVEKYQKITVALKQTQQYGNECGFPYLGCSGPALKQTQQYGNPLDVYTLFEHTYSFKIDSIVWKFN